MASIILKDDARHPLHKDFPKEPAKASPKQSVPALADKDYEAGFNLGKNRQQLEQGASEAKKIGYANGLSTGMQASASSPFQAFNAPEPKPESVKEPAKSPEPTKEEPKK